MQRILIYGACPSCEKAVRVALSEGQIRAMLRALAIRNKEKKIKRLHDIFTGLEWKLTE